MATLHIIAVSVRLNPVFPSEFGKICKHMLLVLFGSAILASSLTQTRNTELYKIGNYIKYVNIPIALFIMFVQYPRGVKKGGGRADERLFQSYIAPIHYFFRFLRPIYIEVDHNCQMCGFISNCISRV